MSSSTSYDVYAEPKGQSLHRITPEKADYIANVNFDGLCTDDAAVTLLNPGTPLNRLQNAFLPAVSLPTEILVMIFEFACYSSDYEYGMANTNKYWSQSRGPDDEVTPLFIGKVCSTWRNIALGTSQLWASVTILVNDKRADMLAAKLRFWLAKSAQHPLTVKLVDDYCRNVTSTAVIDVLVAHAHRLHAFELFVPTAWEPAVTRIANCASSLTLLTLRIPFNYYPIVESVDMFANAPQLREVRLFGYLAGHMFEDVLLPWAQLQSLEGEYHEVRDYLETLLLCPRLRRSVIIGPFDGVEPHIFPPTAHAVLEELELNIFSLRYLKGLLDALTLPALRSFALQVHSSEQYEFISLLPPFLSRSAEALETLYLCDMMPAEEDFVVCLQMLPRLRKLVLQTSSLRLENLPLTDRALDWMNPMKHAELGGVGMENVFGGEGDKGLCPVPNLEALYYKGNIGLKPHTLVEFLAARWRGSSIKNPHIEGPGTQTGGERLLRGLNSAPAVRLRTARFNMPKIEFEDADAAVLQELQSEGMYLEFLEYGTT